MKQALKNLIAAVENNLTTIDSIGVVRIDDITNELEEAKKALEEPEYKITIYVFESENDSCELLENDLTVASVLLGCEEHEIEVSERTLNYEDSNDVINFCYINELNTETAENFKEAQQILKNETTNK